jgi:hypothetical protein
MSALHRSLVAPLCVLALLTLLAVAGPAQAGSAPLPNQALDQRLAALEAKVATLEAKLAAASSALALSPYVRVDAATKVVVFTGVNLHLVNGTGYTDVANGLGNLTIGYNASRGATDDRTGSHYLVVGDLNNYAQYGGIVVGLHNTSSGPWASVSGGVTNTASGPAASVSGGYQGGAPGDWNWRAGGLFQDD